MTKYGSSDELRYRLDKLLRLRQETASLYDQIEAEFDKTYRRYEGTSALVDLVPDFVEALGGLILKGFKILKMPVRYHDMFTGRFVSTSTASRSLKNGESLYENVKTAAKWKLAKDGAKEAAKTYGEKKLEDGLKASAEWLDKTIAWGGPLAAITVKSFFEIGSISFWGSVTVNRMDGKSWSESVTTDAEGVHDQFREKVEQQRDESLGRLDRKIQELRLKLPRSPGGIHRG